MVSRSIAIVLAVGLSGVAGCASLQFSKEQPPGGNALAFRTTEPYLAVVYTEDCKVSVGVLALPGAQRFVALKSGIGSSELGVTFNNGMIASVSQKSDPQIAPLVTSLATAGVFHLDGASSCKVGASLFRIDEEGAIDWAHPLKLPAP